MNLQTWKKAVQERLEEIVHLIHQKTPDTLYGLLTAATILPVVSAVNQGDWAVLATLGSIAGGVGGNLIANQVQNWRDHSAEDLATELTLHAQRDAGWREALDLLLDKIDTLHVAQAMLSETDRDWFVAALHLELEKLGSSIQIDLSGSGAVVLGESNVVAGQGAVVAGRDMSESLLVSGDNNSIEQIIHHYRSDKEPIDEDELHHQIVDYLNWVRERYGSIELRGVRRQDRQVFQLDLETVYVPIAARVSESVRSREIELDTVLEIGDRLIITGGPGSGKTTVLQHIAWTLAMAIGTDRPALAQEKLGLTWGQNDRNRLIPLPIYVPLSAYAQQRRQSKHSEDPSQQTLATYISSYLIQKHAGVDLPTDFFARLLKTGKAVMLLLDGLDEVPNEGERVAVREAIENLVTGREAMRVAAACRTAAYRGRTALGRGFHEIRVQPLSDSYVAKLVEQAYSEVYLHDLVTRKAKTDELLTGIQSLEAERQRRMGKDVNRLVSSPLIVRMLLVVHLSQRRLPEHRAELYMRATDTMLWPEHTLDEEAAEQIGRLIGGSLETHRELVQHLAFAMHERGESLGREIDEDTLKQTLRKVPEFAPLVDDFVALTRLRGTVLEERLGSYSFIHLAFQEYLAARYLAEVVRSEGGVEAIVRYFEKGPILDTWWRESALLVVGYLSLTTPLTARDFVRRLAGIDDKSKSRKLPSAEIQVATAEIAAKACLEWLSEDFSLRAQVAQRLSNIFVADHVMQKVSIIRRARAGDTIGELGDPRFLEQAWYLPNDPMLGFVEITKGPFLMGSELQQDKDAHNRERPQCTLKLPTYYIARYPVTVAQFRAFCLAAGYQPTDTNLLREPLNRPVRYISWHEAIQYCGWLTEQLIGWSETPELLRSCLNRGGSIRLPSEAEWEKAARGADGRIYPWGNDFDPSYCNMSETGIGTTSSVGLFADIKRPYDCLDMVGNVWEWCSTLYQNYPYQIDDGREDLKTEGLRVLRGGAFDRFRGIVRCASRVDSRPVLQDNWVGFRCALSDCN